MPLSPNLRFPSSYDSTTKVISTAVFVLLLIVAVVTHSVAVGCVGALMLAGAYVWSPRGYTIREQSILVHRAIGNVCIPLDGIREVRAATADDFPGCIRLFGNGGLFGYYGLFRTSKLGNSAWYLTSRGKEVVVVTGTKTTLFSPDDVEGFIGAIRTAAPAPIAPTGAPSLDSLQFHGARGLIGTLLGSAVGLAAVGVAAFAMLYSPGPPSYTLTPESLAIHDRFYPVTLRASGVDVERMRVVDFGVDTGWRPTARTNGFANSHYRSGWFRVAGGKSVRMYQADSRHLVLLPPKGDGPAVLLETREPEKFVAEVRQSWSARP